MMSDNEKGVIYLVLGVLYLFMVLVLMVILKVKNLNLFVCIVFNVLYFELFVLFW